MSLVTCIRIDLQTVEPYAVAQPEARVGNFTPVSRDPSGVVIVPASGWYEWKTEQGRKQPYFFSRADGQPLAFAGLLEHWSGFEGEVETYAVLTTAANPLAATVHDRMPVILEPADYARWLDPTVTHSKAVQPLLVPAANEILQVWPVSRRVNRPAEDDAALVAPLMTGTDAFALE